MLAVFSGGVVEVPAELVAAGSRTPSPKTRASELVGRFLGASEPAVSVQLGDLGHLAYSHTNQALLRPRYTHTYYLTIVEPSSPSSPYLLCVHPPPWTTTFHGWRILVY
jgi:hypothetical protein